MSDLISREGLKEVINDLFRTGEYDCNSVLKAIDNAPTVIAVDLGADKGDKTTYSRLQGEWIGDTDYESYQGCYEAYKCNKCGYGLHWRDYCNSDVSKNFCPECGADMREERQHEVPRSNNYCR